MFSYPVYLQPFPVGIPPRAGDKTRNVENIMFSLCSGAASLGGFSPPSSLLSSSLGHGPSSLQIWQGEGNKKNKNKKKSWFKLF
jgi:hypothetical protein